MIAPAPDLEAEGVHEADSGSGATCSSSRSSSSFSDDDGREPVEVPEHENAQTCLLRNDNTKYVHIVQDELHLVCGKRRPINKTWLQELPADARRCSNCF